MTDASVSFAGNLTDDPEVRYTAWDRPGPVPGGGVGSAGAGAVVLHRGRMRDQAEQAAESLAKGSQVVVMGRLQHRTWDRPERQRPIRGRGSGGEPSLGDGDHDQDDKEPRTGSQLD
jgi:single-stranded DNA-binding protein